MHLVPKKISNKDAMAEKLEQGISIVAAIVKRTLGPGGLPVLIERVGQNLQGDPLEPMITKDGVTVARECADADPEVDLTIQTVKAICNKTNRQAGDGTTTAIVLGEAMFLEARKALKADATLNPQLVKESIEASVEKVLKMMEKHSVEVGSDLSKIEQVATISANGEAQIGEIIKKAFEAVGPQGVITVDEGSSIETTIDIVEGYQFNRGAEAQDRFFNNKEQTKFEAKNALVILYDGHIQHHGSLLPLFQQIAQAHSARKMPLPPIVIVANEFSVDTIQFLLINRAEGGLSICAVKSPNVTSVRTSLLEDIAVALGGKKLGGNDKSLEAATFGIADDGSLVGDVGFAGKVVIDRFTTTFYDGGGEEESVKDRIEHLKASRESAFSEYDASQLSDRIASLAQGIAKIGVGGKTELEIKEKYHRIEDALNAARAAIMEGVIPGGGSTTYRVGVALELKAKTVGDRIVSQALKYPLTQILENIGMKVSDIDRLSLLRSKTKVYDARNKKMVNAFKAGIIDPLKVTRTALENATSIAALLSTCGGGITFVRGKQ